MKTLTAFWHWVDNEKPAEITTKQLDTLTDPEQRAIGYAVELVLERMGPAFLDNLDEYVLCDLDSLNELREHWPAVRDLSLSICEAPEQRTCPACHATPCNGSHVSCDMKAYLAGRPEAREEVEPEPAPGKGYVIGVDHGSGTVQLSAAPREKDERLTGVRLGELSAGQIQRAVQRVNEQLYANMAGSQRFQAMLGSGFNHATGRLEIFTTVTVEDLERFRGLRPSSIVLRGTPESYEPRLRAYLAAVIGPMLDRAPITTPDHQCGLEDWGLGSASEPPVVRDPNRNVRTLVLTPTLIGTKDDCDRLRGFSGVREIYIHGRPERWNMAVLDYLFREVLAPYGADGAKVIHPPELAEPINAIIADCWRRG